LLGVLNAAIKMSASEVPGQYTETHTVLGSMQGILTLLDPATKGTDEEKIEKIKSALQIANAFLISAMSNPFRQGIPARNEKLQLAKEKMDALNKLFSENKPLKFSTLSQQMDSIITGNTPARPEGEFGLPFDLQELINSLINIR